MAENLFSEPDPVDELLSTAFAPGDTLELRQAILAQTGPLVRRRLWQRQALWALALAGCFVAGILTAWELRPAQPSVEASDEVAAVVPAPRGEEAPAAGEDMTAVAMEWLALENPERQDRTSLYRRAGDQYLSETQDLDSARRCYAQALDDGANLEVTNDDSWLLMAIKLARKQEIENAKANP
jgi:hypothetical protein